VTIFFCWRFGPKLTTQTSTQEKSEDGREGSTVATPVQCARLTLGNLVPSACADVVTQRVLIGRRIVMR
jgi:hypothetical protein